jgi:hypothetical protein
MQNINNIHQSATVKQFFPTNKDSYAGKLGHSNNSRLLCGSRADLLGTGLAWAKGAAFESRGFGEFGVLSD